MQQDMLRKFAAYAPHFKGPEAIDVAIRDVLSVIYKSSVENGDGGSFVSQFGTKKWI